MLLFLSLRWAFSRMLVAIDKMPRINAGAKLPMLDVRAEVTVDAVQLMPSPLSSLCCRFTGCILVLALVVFSHHRTKVIDRDQFHSVSQFHLPLPDITGASSRYSSSQPLEQWSALNAVPCWSSPLNGQEKELGMLHAFRGKRRPLPLPETQGSPCPDCTL